jgi:uncharacterized membrane protein
MRKTITKIILYVLVLFSIVFVAMVDSLSTITILLCVGTLAISWYYLVKYIKMNFTE